MTVETTYRPFHARECAARNPARPKSVCSCGGLAEALWEPGDEPVTRLT